jgi:hypothetical protein
VNGDDKEHDHQNSQVLPLLVFVGIVLISANSGPASGVADQD